MLLLLQHDAFIDVLRDGETPLLRFTGKQLIMGEPDGSSFPSGGLRATHIARGYTAWDPTSPPFILEHSNGSTLYIPSCFFSWDHGKALDEKIPLLRSEAALQRETLRLFAIIGDTRHTHVHMDAGLEQEFFLIDRAYYLARPDLQITGRTVLGCAPPKGQELEDQYFGHISTRFLDCIHELEVECWKLGIPIQTRHREVAPGQYEVAPKFAPANVATDRNLILKALLRSVTRKHGLAALLGEKPFAKINGSGQHDNYSLGSNITPSFLNPGERPESNAIFMLFLAACIRGVDMHADLMRVAISGVGNDHRLGANEAPPAIVSAYLYFAARTQAWLRLLVGVELNPGPAKIRPARRLKVKTTSIGVIAGEMVTKWRTTAAGDVYSIIAAVETNFFLAAPNPATSSSSAGLVWQDATLGGREYSTDRKRRKSKTRRKGVRKRQTMRKSPSRHGGGDG